MHTFSLHSSMSERFDCFSLQMHPVLSAIHASGHIHKCSRGMMEWRVCRRVGCKGLYMPMSEPLEPEAWHVEPYA